VRAVAPAASRDDGGPPLRGGTHWWVAISFVSLPLQAGEAVVELSINGRLCTVDAEPTAILLDVLRNSLGLLGARFGCGQGQCGACAVLIDGEDKASCAVEIGSLKGKAVVTVEGIGTPAKPHPLQTAILELQAGQCGYCLTGIIVGAKALLDRNPTPTRQDVVAAMSGHLCRCGVHNRIIDAIQLAARRLREAT
jgi:nicotinate dehydrogenase subunit A